MGPQGPPGKDGADGANVSIAFKLFIVKLYLIQR